MTEFILLLSAVYLFMFTITLSGLNDHDNSGVLKHRWIRIVLAILWPFVVGTLMIIAGLFILAVPFYHVYLAIANKKSEEDDFY